MTTPIEVSFDAGQRFADRYIFERLLGSGGMGKVYLVSDTMLGGEKVALKILNGDLSAQEALVQRFLREVQLTRRVTHPNVVRTFDVGNHQGRLYFTMEYIEGQTLKDFMAGEPLEIGKALRILNQICSGLAAIHALDIIHRDLKTSNVIVAPNEVVKITDFGVAKPGSSELTTPDELLGSATHIAPETWRGDESTAAADIYALGVIAYELVTGILPFDGKTPHELMFKHLRAEPVAPIEFAPEIPRWLNSLILRLLDKDPALRPGSAEAVIHEINTRIRRSTVEDVRRAALGSEPETFEDSDGPLLDSEPLDSPDFEARVRAPTTELPPSERFKFTAEPAIFTPEDALAEQQLLEELPPNAPLEPSVWRLVIQDALWFGIGTLAALLGALLVGHFSPWSWTWASKEPLAHGANAFLGAALAFLSSWLFVSAPAFGYALTNPRRYGLRSRLFSTFLSTGLPLFVSTVYLSWTLSSFSLEERSRLFGAFLFNSIASASAAFVEAASGAWSQPALQVAQIGSSVQLIQGAESFTRGVLPAYLTMAVVLCTWSALLGMRRRKSSGRSAALFGLALFCAFPAALGALGDWLIGPSSILLPIGSTNTAVSAWRLSGVVLVWGFLALANSWRERKEALASSQEATSRSDVYSRSLSR